MPGFVDHLAAIIPVYPERSPSVSCLGVGETGRGIQGKEENDQWCIIVRDVSLAASVLEAEQDRKD